MPPPCTTCGEDMTEQTIYVCTQKHVGKGPKIGNATQSCPLAKGAIWVHVANDDDKGVPGIPVTSPGPGSGKDTDDKGFAPFDPLDEASSYAVTIGPLPEGLESKYFLPEIITATGIPVSKGQITSVEFKLDSATDLKVTVKLAGKDAFVPGVKVTVTGPSSETTLATPDQTTPEEGIVTFARLRKSAGYKVKIELTETDQKKYEIIDADTQFADVGPGKKNAVTFELNLFTWIKIQLRDKAADALTDLEAKKLAQPSAKVKIKLLDGTLEEQPVSEDKILEFKMKQKTGAKCELDQVITEGDEYYEFVAVTES